MSNIHVDSQGIRYIKDWYVYSVAVASLAASATAVANLNIQADARFEVIKLAAYADVAGAAQTTSSQVLPLVNMQVTDTGSGRQMFNLATPIPNICGTAQNPLILTNPKSFAPNSNITFSFENISAATTYLNLTISLHGYKLFRL